MAPCSLLVALQLVVLISGLFGPAAAVKDLSDWQSGFITHYGGKQDGMQASNPSFGTKDVSYEGACGYGSIPKDQYPYFSVAALSPSNSFAQAGPLKGCGQCFQIQCEGDMSGKDVCQKDSKGKPLSVLVMISDVCPECEANHIDVQSLAFAKMANPDIGRIKVTYRRVECAPPESVQVSVLDFAGSNGWLRLNIQDTGGRGAVKTVQVKGSNSGSWQPLTNSWGATWELSNAPSPPLDFKITTDDGSEVTANGVIKQNGGISSNGVTQVKFDTGAQFAINDPAVQQVTAFSGEQDPMLVTSDTPGNGGSSSGSKNSSSSGNSTSSGAPSMSVNAPPSSGSGSSSSSNGGGSSGSSNGGSQGCADVAPPGNYPCSQWKAWSKCSEDWLVKGNYCAASCSRCSGGSSSSSSSNSGRKMLRLG
ncbi:hypothetical protein N2152v2_006959 [Parachlorella kessleri]